MFKNNLKIAFRYFAKHKGYTFINTIGLGVGIAPQGTRFDRCVFRQQPEGVRIVKVVDRKAADMDEAAHLAERGPKVHCGSDDFAFLPMKSRFPLSKFNKILG